jgi:hypothetical protein
MAKLFEANKTIRPTSEKLTNSSSRDSVSLNSKRVNQDINRIANFINTLIVPSYKSLASDLKYPYDVLDYGISGQTTITWPENLGNGEGKHPLFWKINNEVDLGRPCTIKESFDWVLSNFTSKIIQIEQAAPDLSELHESIKCILHQIQRLKNEVLTQSYVLDCQGDAAKRYTWSLSTHIYNVISQLTEGMAIEQIAAYEEDPDSTYPSLTIPYSRISNRIEYAYQLKDVDYDGNGATKAANGQLLVWDTSVRDSDLEISEESQGTWVAKYPHEIFTDTDTKIEYIDELKDVEIASEERGNGYVLTWDETVTDQTDSNNTSPGAWVPRDPNDGRVKHITELKDVDTGGTLADDQVLVWDSGHRDSSPEGDLGAWVPKDLNSLIPELPDLTTNIGQRVGTRNNDSTLSDVYSLSEIREAWLAEHSLTDQSAADLDQNLDLTKRAASRFRAGANLIYDGDIWHSKLSGNTSNFNEIEFVPEVYLKQSGYIDGLNSVEKEQLIHGGYNAVPFVFINNFDVKMKELLEPNFKIMVAYSTNGQVPLTGNQSLDLLSQSFDETSIGSILNSNPSKSGKLLENEISTNDPSRPIGSMKVSEKYNDENGIERVYYKPEKLLGVCRTDMGLYEIPLAGLPEQKNFSEDSEGNLTGEINPLLPSTVQTKVAKNVGIEVQHSGYSRIMVLGPYVHGDNLYICPAPVLEAAGINYPYGICISDTFLSTPLKELFLGEKDILLSSTYPSIYSQANFSVYDVIADLLATVDNELKNKILSCPVAFVTRDDSPFASLDISSTDIPEDIENHNIANIICRNLLGLNNTGLSTGSGVYLAILSYFNDIDSAERVLYQNDVLHASGGSLATKYIYNAGSLHLPLCKIAIGSFNHEGVKETVSSFDWATYISPSIVDGYLNLGGLSLGLVTGQDGATGEAGPQGTAGSVGSSMSPINYTYSEVGSKNLDVGGESSVWVAPIVVSPILFPQMAGSNYTISVNLNFNGLLQKLQISLKTAAGTINISDGTTSGSSLMLDNSTGSSSISFISDILSVNDALNLEIFFELTEDTDDMQGWAGVYSSHTASYTITKS